MKSTFRQSTFSAKTFANCTWRWADDTVPPDVPGAEFRLNPKATDYGLLNKRTDLRLPTAAIGSEAKET